MTRLPEPLPDPDRLAEGPERRGYRNLNTLARPYRPAFGAADSDSGKPAGIGADSERPMPRGRDGKALRAGAVLVLAIGAGIGVVLAVAIFSLGQDGAGATPLVLAVALAGLFGPILTAMLALRLVRALSPAHFGDHALGSAGSAEAAADAANAAPDAVAVTDSAGRVLFANRGMRRLAPGIMGSGAVLPEFLSGVLDDDDPDAAIAQENGPGERIRLLDGRHAALESWPLPHPEGRRLWRVMPEQDRAADADAAGLAAIVAALESIPGVRLRLTGRDPARHPAPAACAASDMADAAEEGEDAALLQWRALPAANSVSGRAVGFRFGPGQHRLWLIAEDAAAVLSPPDHPPDHPLDRSTDLPPGLTVSPVCAAVLDSSGAIRAANSAFAAMTGWDGSPVPLATLLADGEAEAEALARALAVADQQEGEMAPATLRFGRHPERSLQLYPGPLVPPVPTGTRLALLIDVTEHKGVEQQVAHGQKMQAIGQLAGGVAHDFNNLLTAMIGFCDLLLQRHPPTDQSFADVQQIKQNALRAAGLVRQLLAFSRRQTLRPRNMDLTDVLADLRHLLSRLIGERIQLRILHGRDLGIVRVDRGQLEQVIINLAVNARDAMRDGGILTITTAVEEIARPQDRGNNVIPAGRYVRIDIADTGTGVPQQYVDKIFDPFFTTKKPGEGTGLGLSTVYGIIRQTGGFVFLERNGSDGATFAILLPESVPDSRGAAGEAGTGDGPEGEVRTPPQDLTGRETLLLVEDEDAVRLFATRSLRNKGYTVLEADSGEAALQLIGNHDGTIHALITDVAMPNMDGPTLAQQILKDRPGTVLVFMSGYAEDAVRQAISGGDLHAAFLQKPFTLNELATAVKVALWNAESAGGGAAAASGTVPAG